jgi:ATP-binding protein involved in chromosome partitioning
MSEDKTIRFAVPTAKGQLCLHFGHCECFTIIDIEQETKQIIHQESLIPPAHEPGVLPRWLGEQQVDVVIAGGMGQRAQMLFAQSGVKVVIGATQGSPEEIVTAYLDETLTVGDNICDH